MSNIPLGTATSRACVRPGYAVKNKADRRRVFGAPK